MITVYYAIGIDLRSLKLYTDIFYDKEDAFNCAWRLAEQLTLSTPEDFIAKPQMSNESSENKTWMFANGSSSYVAVEEWRIAVPTVNSFGDIQVGKFPDELSSLLDLFASKDESKTIVDDPWEDSLPGTFAYGTNVHRKKPLRIADIKADPHNALYTFELSDQERAALVTARIRKRPGYSFSVNSENFDLLLNQNEALAELNVLTNIGIDIIDNECGLIDDFIDKMKDEDESSSSSSEEEEYDDEV
jgi:hypothetical protein